MEARLSEGRDEEITLSKMAVMNELNANPLLILCRVYRARIGFDHPFAPFSTRAWAGIVCKEVIGIPA